MKLNKSTLAYIGLGSNLDNPLEQIQSAIQEIAQLSATSLDKVSKFYRNPPMGYLNQPDFVNAVVEITTTLSAEKLLEKLQQIEELHKRVRGKNRNGPRTLDLDLLLYSTSIIQTPALTIPHPGLKQRSFVIYPLADLNQDLVLPCGTSIKMLMQEIPATDLKVIDPELIM